MAEDILSAKIEHLEREAQRREKHMSILLNLAQTAAEPRRAAEHFVNRAIEIVCHENNWLLGQFWLVSESEDLVHCAPWYFSSAHLPEFRAASVDRHLSKGVGLPGRVWSTGLPLLIADINLEAGLNFTRKSIALKTGLNSGFGFAIKNGPFVTAVCEFFDVKPIHTDMVDALFYEKLGIYIAKIMAQKQLEQACQSQEEVNNIILNHAYNAFIAIDETSQIVQWTTRAADLFGWRADEVFGKTVQEIIIPERYRDAHIKGLFRYLTTKEAPVLNKRLRVPALHKDGHELDVELLIFPILTLNTRRFGAFIVDTANANREPEIRLE